MNFETPATTVRTRTPRIPGVLLVGLLAAILPGQDEPKSPLNLDIKDGVIVMSLDENQGVALTDFIKIAEKLTKKLYVFPAAEGDNPQNRITCGRRLG